MLASLVPPVDRHRVIVFQRLDIHRGQVRFGHRLRDCQPKLNRLRPLHLIGNDQHFSFLGFPL